MRTVKIKNLKIKNLKIKHPLIYKRALECQKEQGNESNIEKFIEEDKFEGNFTWDKTDEGSNVWYAVSIGDFEIWYDFHKLHEPQISISKYSIF